MGDRRVSTLRWDGWRWGGWRWIGWALAAVALVVVVVGLLPGRADPVGEEERADALASNLRCPFCAGESIADAPSQTARDLEGFISEKVAEGWTDDEIYGFFVGRYGEGVRLDPPLAGWGAALWLTPLALIAVGVAAIAGRRRPGAPTGEGSETGPPGAGDRSQGPEEAPPVDAGDRIGGEVTR